MVDAASKDRLDPGLKRDLFFGDFAYTRRGLVSNLVGVVILSLGLLACLYAGGELRRFVFLTGSVVLTLGLHASRHAAAVWRRGELRTPTNPGADPGPRMIERAFDRLRAQAEDDADLASDPRLALETRKARGLRILSRSAAVLQRTVGAAILVVGARYLIVDVQAFFRPAPPLTVELVDVILIPWSTDFHTAITVDVTGGQVSKIAPYDTRHAMTVTPHFRSFEALGKYLVAGDTIDLSRPGWLNRFTLGVLRPIDVGTSGDFLILDVDPRTHDITADDVAAAVIKGAYYSRQDIRRIGR